MAGASRQQELEAVLPIAPIIRKQRAEWMLSPWNGAAHSGQVFPLQQCNQDSPYRCMQRLISQQTVDFVGSMVNTTSTVIISKLKLKELYMWLTLYHWIFHWIRSNINLSGLDLELELILVRPMLLLPSLRAPSGLLTGNGRAPDTAKATHLHSLEL